MILALMLPATTTNMILTMRTMAVIMQIMMAVLRDRFDWYGAHGVVDNPLGVRMNRRTSLHPDAL